MARLNLALAALLLPCVLAAPSKRSGVVPCQKRHDNVTAPYDMGNSTFVYGATATGTGVYLSTGLPVRIPSSSSVGIFATVTADASETAVSSAAPEDASSAAPADTAAPVDAGSQQCSPRTATVTSTNVIYVTVAATADAAQTQASDSSAASSDVASSSSASYDSSAAASDVASASSAPYTYGNATDTASQHAMAPTGTAGSLGTSSARRGHHSTHTHRKTKSLTSTVTGQAAASSPSTSSSPSSDSGATASSVAESSPSESSAPVSAVKASSTAQSSSSAVESSSSIQWSSAPAAEGYGQQQTSVPTQPSTSSSAAPATSATQSSTSGGDFYQVTSAASAASSVHPTTSSTAPAASSSSPPSLSGSTGTGKRGLAYTNAALTQCFDYDTSQVSWGYNWDSQSRGLSPHFEYVPMMWGLKSWAMDNWFNAADAALAAGSRHLLSFNEPDMAGQADLTVSAAVAAHKKYMDPYKGRARISSPAVSNAGLKWLGSFLDSCTDCTIDFVAVHWYDSASNVAYFKSYINDVIALAKGKPVWLTEFGGSGSQAEQVKFLQEIMPWLDQQAGVERYAWFGVFDGNLVSGQTANPLGNTFATYSP